MSELEGQISLADYLNKVDPPPGEEETDYKIPSSDDVEASKLLRSLAATEKQIKANSQMAESERAKITQWESVTNEPLQNRALWLRARLEDYAIAERLRDESRKTISLPFGTLSTRPANPKWEIADKDGFVAWAESQDGIADLVRIKKEPQMTVIKSAFDATPDGDVVDVITGQVIPGVKVTAPEQPFNPTVKPSS